MQVRRWVGSPGLVIGRSSQRERAGSERFIQRHHPSVVRSLRFTRGFITINRHAPYPKNFRLLSGLRALISFQKAIGELSHLGLFPLFQRRGNAYV